MRSFFSLCFVFVAACGGSSSTTNVDFASAHDLAITNSSQDLSATASGDMKVITPYNMAGSVFCYDSTACSTTGSSPVCCDAENSDGGFSDTCVASATACTTISSTAHAYACGQAADCATGQICCGAISTTHLTGSTCETTCGTGESQLCVTAAECKTGSSCVGKDITGRDVGVCQ